MSHSTRGRTLVVAAVLAVGLGGWWGASRLAAAERRADTDAALATAANERAIRSADIAFYARRAAEDPQSAADRTLLASLYVQRARETSDFADYLRADSIARVSLALRTRHNGGAWVALVSALLAQHRFGEARAAAEQLVAGDPQEDSYRALLGETCLELGDYAAAGAAFEAIGSAARKTAAMAPSLARWAEIRGDTALARLLIRRGLGAADSTSGVPREQVAWYHLRAGELELRQGRAASAEREFAAGLGWLPGDHRLLAAMARLAAAEHDWPRAIALGDSAIAAVLDPATLGVVADAYAALGDSAQAADYERTMEVAVGQQPGAYHRAWSLFLLDHDRQIPAVLAAAQAELEGRRDIYGYDLVAWALYRSGRMAEARDAMRHALAQGTQDALLFYHAGMIARAAGDDAAAADYLRRSLAASDVFDPHAPARAHAVLDTLRRGDAAGR